jgi:hypothetical protein
VGRPKGSKNQVYEAKAPEQGKYVEVASIKHTEDPEKEKLRLQVEDLTVKLALAEAKRSKAEQKALESADAEVRVGDTEIQGRPTGKTVKVSRCKSYKVVGHKDNGQPILQPVFEMVDVPTYFYKIDMPPCGGIFLRINGEEFYHGTTYELDLDTLRTIKDIVWRTWSHDRDIHGSDENFYRKQDPAWQTRNARVVTR